MTIKLVSDEKIAVTSSKGNQEKWREAGRWYKVDQFGYEALAEAAASTLLEWSNIEKETPFTFVRYQMERVNVHGRERTGCSSENFLRPGQSIVTLDHLLSRVLGRPLRDALTRLPSDKKRIEFLAETTAEYTGLREFPQYLTLLFEIDGLFLNDDRHLNNIAVLEQGGQYSYCPIFDNGAGLLSNTQFSPMDISPAALVKAVKARPFNTTFNRQIIKARDLYGPQLKMPRVTAQDIAQGIEPMLVYYPARDRGIIADRVTETILIRQSQPHQ